MTNGTSTKPPVWFWIVSVLALAWNALGAMAYLSQKLMSDETLAALPDAERALYENQPTWVTAAFAFAVWGGLLGCILLLLRKKWAKTVLWISLLGIIAQMYHSFFMSNNFDVYGPGAMVMPVMVIIIGVGLVLFARYSQKKHWIS